MVCPFKFMKCISETNQDFKCLLCEVKIVGEGSKIEKQMRMKTHINYTHRDKIENNQ